MASAEVAPLGTRGETELGAGRLGLAVSLGPWLLSAGVSLAAWASSQHGG